MGGSSARSMPTSARLERRRSNSPKARPRKTGATCAKGDTNKGRNPTNQKKEGCHEPQRSQSADDVPLALYARRSLEEATSSLSLHRNLSERPAA